MTVADIESTIDFRQPNSGRNKGDKKMENKYYLGIDDKTGNLTVNELNGAKVLDLGKQPLHSSAFELQEALKMMVNRCYRADVAHDKAIVAAHEALAKAEDEIEDA